MPRRGKGRKGRGNGLPAEHRVQPLNGGRACISADGGYWEGLDSQVRVTEMKNLPQTPLASEAPINVSLRDVASRAGVHFTTVSRALRDDPRLPAATRDRLKRLAENLGYKLNPMASAMMSRRRHGRSVYLGTLAFVTRGDDVSNKARVKQLPSWTAASRRADELGFKLERFLLADYGGKMAALCRALRNRGVLGVLLNGLTPEQIGAGDYTGMAVVSTYEWQTVPVLRTDHFRNILLAAAKISAEGHRRLAFVPWSLMPASIVEQCRAAALLATADSAEGLRIEVAPPREHARLPGFLRRFRPDAVLIGGYMEGIAVRQYLYDTIEGGPAGVDHRRGALAEQMVSWVTSLISQHQFGLPPERMTVLVPGRWQDGPPLRGPL